MTETNKNFLLNMWLQGRVTAQQVETAYINGKITQAERDEILATSRGL